MAKLRSAILCHKLDSKLNPIVLRDHFDISDVLVILRLEYEELAVNRPLVQLVTWTHESGQSISIQNELVPSRPTGVVATVLAPWTITTTGMHPKGSWRVRVEVEDSLVFATTFDVRSADRTPPRFVDTLG